MCERHCRARAVRVGVCVLVALAGTAGAATVTTGPATSTLTSAGPAQAVRGARLTARLLAHAARSLGHLRDGRVVGRGGRILCLLRFARRVDPLCPAANAQLVELQESLGSPAEAARAAADYLRVRPDDYTMALRWLGLSQATTDSAGQRVALLQAALKQRRFPAEVRAAAAAELAAVYVRQGEVELARRACAQALRLDPYQRAALQTQGRLDQKADAAATLRRMLLQLQGAPRDLSLCTAIARDLQGAGLYEQALVFYEHAQALAKVKPPAFAQYEQLLVDHCNALLDAGRPEQAARTFAPMVEEHPLNLALRSLLIEAYRALKDERRAAAQVTAMGGIYRAASASPKRSPAQTVELAWYELRYRGRPESALKLARKAVAGDASDTFARMVLAAAELAAGHAGPARAVLTELAPRRPYAAVVLARYYYAHGQPQAARTVLLKGAGDVRTGPAWRELRSLAKEKGVALPPLPRAAAMARVARQLPPEVLEMGRRPERFLRVSLSAPRAVVQVGEPVVVTVTLENVSQRRLPLGPDGLLAPVVALGLSIGGDLQADLPELTPVVLPAPKYLPVGGKVSRSVRVDVGRAEVLLEANPLGELELTVGAVVDPLRSDKRLASSVPALTPGTVKIRRARLLSPQAGRAEVRRRLALIVQDLLRGGLEEQVRAARQTAALLGLVRSARSGKGKSRPPAGLEKLVLLSMTRAAIRSPSALVRAEMLAALQRVDLDERTIAVLAPCIQDRSALVRMRLVELLGAGRTAGFERLRRYFAADRDALVRQMSEAVAGGGERRR